MFHSTIFDLRFLLMLILLTGSVFSNVKKVAEVVDLKGNVYSLRRFKKIPLEVKQPLQRKDYLFTKEESFLEIELLDRSTVNLGENSKLKMTEVVPADKDGKKKKVILELMAGTIRARVKSFKTEDEYFVVKTPSAVVGVRGTDFVVKHFPRKGKVKARSLITVIKGKVIVTPFATRKMIKRKRTGKMVVLQENQQTSVKKAEQPSAPITLPDIEMQKIKNEVPVAGEKKPNKKGLGEKLDKKRDPSIQQENPKEIKDKPAIGEDIDKMDTVKTNIQNRIRETQQQIRNRIIENIQETIKTEVHPKINIQPVPLPENKD